MGKSDTLFSGILSQKLVPGSSTSCSTSGLVLSLSNNGVDSCTGEGGVRLKSNWGSASGDKYDFSNNGKDSCAGGGGGTCLSVKNKSYKLNPL